jgi:flavin reductase (DIM6/NTAB) family NADH-FMN oxidoreductase RutF
MPSFDPSEMPDRAAYLLLTSLVVPRPIAWVGSRGADGVDNLAPHSYFNIISTSPAIVHFTSSGVKDTLRNVRATGAFTVSMVDEPLLEAMNTTAVDAPPGVSEFDLAGVARAEGLQVPAPYAAGSPAVLECTVRTILTMGTGSMVFGDVLRIAVRDDVWGDGRVDLDRYDPVGRLSGSWYAVRSEVRKLVRPTWAELQGG